MAEKPKDRLLIQRLRARDYFSRPPADHLGRVLTFRSFASTLGSPFSPCWEASVIHAAVGFRVHSGWTALVAVSLENQQPLVLCRKRVQLVEIFNYDFRQPYHTAKKTSLEDGREFISTVKSQAAKLAAQALHETQKELKLAGYRLAAATLLLAAGRVLPVLLEEILASHALIHTADGELFREALVEACSQCKLPLLRLKEKKLLAEAAQSLQVGETVLQKRITELGKPLGAPWSQDEKFATLAAWLALSKLGNPKRVASRARLA
jgi:hypothetical protein